MGGGEIVELIAHSVSFFFADTDWAVEARWNESDDVGGKRRGTYGAKKWQDMINRQRAQACRLEKKKGIEQNPDY